MNPKKRTLRERPPVHALRTLRGVPLPLRRQAIEVLPQRIARATGTLRRQARKAAAEQAYASQPAATRTLGRRRLPLPNLTRRNPKPQARRRAAGAARRRARSGELPGRPVRRCAERCDRRTGAPLRHPD